MKAVISLKSSVVTSSAVLPALAALLFLASQAHAQTFCIDWFTMDGGGGASAGGTYSVSGTIGQPDAGVMSGGPYSLEGGFWGVVAIQTPGAPFLHIAHTNGTVAVRWEKPATGFVLDQTPAMASPPSAISWTQVPFPYQTNATHISISIPMPSGNKFYRLRKL